MNKTPKYNFDGQVVRTADKEYVCELLAWEPALFDQFLKDANAPKRAKIQMDFTSIEQRAMATVEGACIYGMALQKVDVQEDGMLEVTQVDPGEYFKVPPQLSPTLRFPTMLRKMWSGSEVQDWLDKQGPFYTAPPAKETVATLKGFPQAFVTAESCQGKYRIVMSFESLDSMHTAHRQILALLAAPGNTIELRNELTDLANTMCESAVFIMTRE